MTSAATRVTPTWCDAWASSHELILGISPAPPELNRWASFSDIRLEPEYSAGLSVENDSAVRVWQTSGRLNSEWRRMLAVFEAPGVDAR
jgi:hypothetical protein